MPEVVRLDDVGRVNVASEVLLQHLKDRLNEGPGRTPHVDDHGEAKISDVIAGKEKSI